MIPTRAGAAINLFSFGTSFGTMFYTTFIFGITAFKNLPRQTFGKLQSKLFPKYFSLCSATMLLQVRTYIYGRIRICYPIPFSTTHIYLRLNIMTAATQILTLRSLPLEISKSVIWSLGSALSATLLNQFMLEPYSTKIMLERYDIENTKGGLETERYKELKASFGKMHGISSLSNLIALCGQVAYGFILSSVLLA